MESKSYLRAKNCSCCLIRLDIIPKRDVRRISDNNLLNTLNTVKPIILTNKRKEIDQTRINIDDFICGNCIHYAKKFKKDNDVPIISTSIYPSLICVSEASTSQPSTSQPSTLQSSTADDSDSDIDNAKSRLHNLYSLFLPKHLQSADQHQVW